ncbi:Asp-tRNA(Asn)/Glu-tRNA(Gln) amidotransferase subunit GatB [Tistrella mobilis]|jgi:aspartyl-tRNA(Asn)/glutamyl-tRNA(Gln) amidotransferase subunit B|uniref:Asp-tRNA(Asn)/Glu-tRNA(Gln) amidotransferase subunit GatB n=1 Tax=Tistrella mobilis TaxID=171437 RepID=UPI00355704A1
MSLIRGNTGDWEIVIGLEVHAQVSSNAKLFSGAATAYGAEPNTQVSLIDAAMPGMLPVINEWCVAQAVRTGIALNAQINRHSVFDRKNYFYPDLPQGYQISQFKQPIVGEGAMVIDLDDGETMTVGIERLHLEQDAGKSMHDQRPGETLIDLNRSGVALMEIVSKPDMRSPEQAGAYMRKLRTILRYIGSCDGNMEEGSLRCDANVSVRRPGGPLGTRCEIKNLNSIRHIMRAIEFEAHRQIAIIEDGGAISQETRLYDVNKGETRTMRSKEEAHDYRYFPDPDLLPLKFDEAFVEAQRAALPELPDAKKARFQDQYGLSAYDAGVLVGEQVSADFFETAAKGRDAKLVANWMSTELFGALNRLSKGIEESPVSAEALGGLVDLIQDGTISGRIAKEVFAEMLETGETAGQVVERKGLKQVSDEGAIAAAIDQVIAANPDKLAEYKGGKTKLAGFFVGQVMKATGGKANPQVVNRLLDEKLNA